MSKTYGDVLQQIKEDVTSRIRVLQENIDNQKKKIAKEIDAGDERNYHITRTTLQVNMDALEWQKDLLVAAAKADSSIELPKVYEIQPVYHNKINVHMSGLDPFGKNHGGVGNFTVHTHMDRILIPAWREESTAISRIGVRLNKSTLFLLKSGAYHSIRDHFHPIPKSHMRDIINKLIGHDVSILSRDDTKRKLVGWALREDQVDFRTMNFGDHLVTVPLPKDSVFYTDESQTHLWARFDCTVRHIIGEPVTE